MPVVRLNKQGFPKSMSLAEFQRRFSLLSKNDSLLESTDDRATVENILIDAEVDHSSYRIGFSEVGLSSLIRIFFRIESRETNFLSKMYPALSFLSFFWRLALSKQTLPIIFCAAKNF